MPFVHGKGARVLFGEYNLSSFLNEASFAQSLETGETTVFGNNSKTYIAGLADGTVSLSGMFDGSAGASDEILEASLGNDSGRVVTIGVEGFVVGKRVSLLKAKSTSYEVSSPVSDVVSLSAEVQADGGIDPGVSLLNLAQVTTTGFGSSVDNAASSANGGVAHLHVTANAQTGNTIVKVQHSANNSTWVDLVTFATVATTVETSERIEVAAGTTVNRYLRASYNLASTGGVTLQVSFSRR